jgi:hypothetical protein
MVQRGPLRKAPAAVLAACCGIAALAGCSGRANVGATGTAPPEIEHLWVTVEQVWFASAADTPTESDTGWTRRTLSTPVVLDLASVEPGTLVPIVSNLSLPAGRYRQLHLGIADSGDRLVDSARAVGLEYNAQVGLRSDAGAVSRAPLELPVPRAGLTIPVDLTVEGAEESGATDGTGSVANLAVTLDAARDVLTYDYGAITGYILSPSAVVDDAARSGEIRGSVDTTGLAADHPAITVSAQTPAASGTHHVVVQRRRVAADGSFSLYPLPASKDGATRYEVVIACAGADTVIVRDVPVQGGTDATTLQPAPIVLAPARTVHADTVASSVDLPAGTRVEFYQALPGREDLPYLIDGSALDPLTRRMPGNAFALASGSLLVGTYQGGEAISFAATAPAEGSGGYRVGSAGPYRADTLATGPVEVTGNSSRPSTVTVPFPEIAAGGRAGRLTVNLQAPAGRYDRGFVTVMAGHRVVETVGVDALVERGGGTIVVTGLPAGSELAPPAGVPYRAALRAWNSRNPAGTIVRVGGAASATLGDGGTGVLLLQAQ